MGERVRGPAALGESGPSLTLGEARAATRVSSPSSRARPSRQGAHSQAVTSYLQSFLSRGRLLSCSLAIKSVVVEAKRP